MPEVVKTFEGKNQSGLTCIDSTNSIIYLLSIRQVDDPNICKAFYMLGLSYDETLTLQFWIRYLE